MADLENDQHLEKELKMKEKEAQLAGRNIKKKRKKDKEKEKAKKVCELNKICITEIKEKGFNHMKKLTVKQPKDIVRYHFCSNKYNNKGWKKMKFVSFVCEKFESGKENVEGDDIALDDDLLKFCSL